MWYRLGAADETEGVGNIAGHIPGTARESGGQAIEVTFSQPGKSRAEHLSRSHGGHRFEEADQAGEGCRGE